MAAPTLSVLTHPHFPQVFARAIDQEITRVEEVLRRCGFEDEHCDCRARATVHDLATEQDFCLRHFQEVRRG